MAQPNLRITLSEKGMTNPISVARELKDHGLSLAASHAAISKLSRDGTVDVEVTKVPTLIAALAAYGIVAEELTRQSAPARFLIALQAEPVYRQVCSWLFVGMVLFVLGGIIASVPKVAAALLAFAAFVAIIFVGIWTICSIADNM